MIEFSTKTPLFNKPRYRVQLDFIVAVIYFSLTFSLSFMLKITLLNYCFVMKGDDVSEMIPLRKFNKAFSLHHPFGEILISISLKICSSGPQIVLSVRARYSRCR